MKRCAIATALLLAVGSTQKAGAEEGPAWLTGNDLVRNCSNSRNYFSYGVCAGYVTGVAEVMKQPEWPYSAWTACLADKNIEMGQLVAIVKKYLAKHPDQLHLRAFELVARALAQAFPCPSR